VLVCEINSIACFSFFLAVFFMVFVNLTQFTGHQPQWVRLVRISIWIQLWGYLLPRKQCLFHRSDLCYNNYTHCKLWVFGNFPDHRAPFLPKVPGSVRALESWAARQSDEFRGRAACPADRRWHRIVVRAEYPWWAHEQLHECLLHQEFLQLRRGGQQWGE
jgi:hypothetical protein